MALTKVKSSNITLSTPAANSNDTTPATTAYVTTALANLVDSAPSTLNTLNELAAALGDDANFSTTVTNSIAAKAPLASPTFTSNFNGGDNVELRLGDSQDILFKHHSGGYGHLENKTGTLYMDSETFTIRTDVDDLGTALFIDASQRVGIGTTSPSEALVVNGNVKSSRYILEGTDSATTRYIFTDNTNTSGTGRLIIQSGGGSAGYGGSTILYSHSHGSNPGDVVAGISTGSGGSFRVNTSGVDGGNDVFKVQENGKVGIGTTSPDQTLTVSSASAIVAKFLGEGGPHGLNIGGNDAGFGYIGHVSSGSYDLSIALDSNGNANVGIGTTSPARTLHVNSSDANVASFEGHQGEGVVISSGTNGRIDIIGYDDGASSYNPLVLRAATDGLVVDTNGRVGIGTGSSADTQLHVKNTAGIELRLEADSNNSGQEDCFIRFYTDGKTQEGIAGMDNNNSSTLFSNNTENAMVFGTVSNLPTVLATNNTERILINNNGVVEVQAAGGGEFKVNATASGSNDAGISTQLPGYAASLYTNFFSSGNNIYFVLGGNYVSYINSSGQYIVSDERLKENVTNLTGSLDKIKQLRGVNFTWKEPSRGTDNNIGFIAQEVEPIIPEIVEDGGLPDNEDGEAAMKTVSYEHLVPHLVEAIKELEARVKELEG